MSVQHTGKTVALILGLGVSTFIQAPVDGNSFPYRTWKFMHLENGTRMLFDMYSAQHEKANLIDQYPEVAVKLEKKLAAWRDQQHRSGFPREYGSQDANFFDHYFDFD